jgi:hypothetical protein
LSLIFLAIKATRFSSETLKNAITKKIKKIIIAKTNHTHFDPELLNAENVQRAHTAHIAKTISWIKLTENHIIEKATQEKNHFFICCGNITFIEHIHRNKISYGNYIHFF